MTILHFLSFRLQLSTWYAKIFPEFIGDSHDSVTELWVMSVTLGIPSGTLGFPEKIQNTSSLLINYQLQCIRIIMHPGTHLMHLILLHNVWLDNVKFVTVYPAIYSQKLYDLINYVTFCWMTCGFMRLATLQFETKLQKCIRMGITLIFKISFGEVYRRIYVWKSRLTAPLARRRKTKSQLYIQQYLPKSKISNTVIP